MGPVKAAGQTQTQFLFTNPPFSHVGGLEHGATAKIIKPSKTFKN